MCAPGAPAGCTYVEYFDDSVAGATSVTSCLQFQVAPRAADATEPVLILSATDFGGWRGLYRHGHRTLGGSAG